MTIQSHWWVMCYPKLQGLGSLLSHFSWSCGTLCLFFCRRTAFWNCPGLIAFCQRCLDLLQATCKRIYLADSETIFANSPRNTRPCSAGQHSRHHWSLTFWMPSQLPRVSASHLSWLYSLGTLHCLLASSATSRALLCGWVCFFVPSRSLSTCCCLGHSTESCKKYRISLYSEPWPSAEVLAQNTHACICSVATPEPGHSRSKSCFESSCLCAQHSFLSCQAWWPWTGSGCRHLPSYCWKLTVSEAQVVGRLPLGNMLGHCWL